MLPKYVNLGERKFGEETVGTPKPEKKKKLSEIGLSGIKDFISDSDAKRFNLTISESLFDMAEDANWWGSGTKLDQVSVSDEVSKELTFFEKLKGLFKKNQETSEPINPVVKRRGKEVTLDVSAFFENLKVEAGREREFLDNVETYIRLIQKSHEMHQTAQSEKLLMLLIGHIYNAVLYNNPEFSHYVTIQELEKLQAQCERELDIDYIENFGRVVPDQVVEIKKKADELGVFDNYMVLYYNPTGELWKTAKEKKREEEQKRDPILFGVINGSDRLYKITDWIDLYCDLTWDELIQKVATETVDIKKELTDIVNGNGR